MGLTKTDQFTPEQNQIAALAKALAHPARVAILQVLLERNACVCGDIVDELPLAQPTVSQHLKELKQAGLIKGTIEGTSICYCIDEAVWQQAQATLMELFAAFASDKNCC